MFRNSLVFISFLVIGAAYTKGSPLICSDGFCKITDSRGNKIVIKAKSKERARHLYNGIQKVLARLPSKNSAPPILWKFKDESISLSPPLLAKKSSKSLKRSISSATN